MANQSNDSGICNTSATAAATTSAAIAAATIKDQVNHFLSKANSNSHSCSSNSSHDEQPLLPLQQLETCNDIEAAIIAAARAAAAATGGSASCSRRNSQEPPPATTKAADAASTSAATTRTATTAIAAAAAKLKSRPAIYMTYGDVDDATGARNDDEDQQLRELSFMPDLKSDFAVANTTSPLLPLPLLRQSNTDLIVDYISNCKSLWPYSDLHRLYLFYRTL